MFLVELVSLFFETATALAKAFPYICFPVGLWTLIYSLLIRSEKK